MGFEFCPGRPSRDRGVIACENVIRGKQPRTQPEALGQQGEALRVPWKRFLKQHFSVCSDCKTALEKNLEIKPNHKEVRKSLYNFITQR